MRIDKLIMRIALVLLILMAMGSASASLAMTSESEFIDLETYTVRQDDSLYVIAKRFNTTVGALQSLNGLTNPRLVMPGERILVPRLDSSKWETYEIVPGDSLYEIALRYETTVAELLSLNGIGDRRHIVAGQTILLPKPPIETVRSDFGYGIVLLPDDHDPTALVRQVEQLGLKWVKLEVAWANIEPEASRYDFNALDALIAALQARDIQILLNIHAAPDWARASYTEGLSGLLRANTGPPEDLAVFGDFMRVLAARYAGLVDAYEIWKAPNILKYWTAPVYHHPPALTADGDYGLPDAIDIGARHYLPLLETAYRAVKSVDEGALVITGGLAPVGITDHYNAVETGTFLQNMLREGAGKVSDGIGAIFGASAVPPTLLCCEQPPGVDTHYESHLQYYREILIMYHSVLIQNHAEDMPIYVTQVGWGTAEGLNLAIPAGGLEWLRYTDLEEQASYVAQAFELTRALQYIDGMFLYNLNGCAAGDQEACFFSLIDAASNQRPAFDALRELPKHPPLT